MKRGWVWVALLLSIGINIGVLATIGVSRSRAAARWERPREEDRTPPFERVANHLVNIAERAGKIVQVTAV